MPTKALAATLQKCLQPLYKSEARATDTLHARRLGIARWQPPHFSTFTVRSSPGPPRRFARGLPPPACVETTA